MIEQITCSFYYYWDGSGVPDNDWVPADYNPPKVTSLPSTVVEGKLIQINN